jgi:RNA polymerase sigma factor for flagellar operon FliA
MTAEQDLVSQGLPVVMTVCRQLARRLGGKVPIDDLAGIGNLALLDVARTWDPSRASFAAYAALRLRWAILDGLRRETHGRTIAARAAALMASDRLAEAQDEEPEPEVPTTQDEDEAALSDLLGAHAAALAVGLFATEQAVPMVESPEDVVGKAEAAHKVRGAIGALPDRERALLERHYYGGEPFDVIAQDLGISKSWASRLHERAILSVQRTLLGLDDGASAPKPPTR